MLPEKWISVAIAAAIAVLWWNGGWGSPYSFIGDYLSSIKIGIFILSCFVCFRVFLGGLLWPAGFYLVIALAYNPFIRLKLDKENWMVIDFVAGIAALWAGFQIFKFSRFWINRRKMAEARAEAIDEAIADGRLDPNIMEDFMKKLKGE